MTARAVWTDPALAVVVIAGTVGFLWPLYDMTAALQTWEGRVWEQPAMAATLIRSTIFALVAIAGASGLSMPSLFKGLAK